uniref:vomeronasal type-2 receptor 26-like n=1 Tax=Podarcis muralis TaxID=64176 RepID=UPI0010A0750E|nr:vomeronasal type-2 receptor 26-like [Podarcis muralis]
MLELLAGSGCNIPNYHCGEQNHLLAVLEGGNTVISRMISALSGIYKIPQISYGFTAQVLESKTLFPFVYRMTPKEESQYQGIVELLLYFGWTWIGIFTPDNDSGERFESAVKSLMLSKGICIAFSKIIPENDIKQSIRPGEPFFLWRQVGVFVSYITNALGVMILLAINMAYEKEIGAKVWVTTALLEIRIGFHLPPDMFQHLHGSLSFAIQTGIRSSKGDKLQTNLLDYLNQAFPCSYSKHLLSVKGRVRCREEEKLQPLPQAERERTLSLDSYGTYIQCSSCGSGLACFAFI